MLGSVILSLLQNTAILLAFSMLYDYTWVKEESSKNWYKKVLAGLMVSSVGLILMFSPLRASSGITFDTRSILLSVSGLFLGPIPTITAMIILGVSRILMGGAGLWMGLAVIVSAGTIGLLWSRIYPSWREGKYQLKLLAMGFLVHFVMIMCTVFLPRGEILPTLRMIFIPILFIYSPGTMLLGIQMLSRMRNWQNKKELDETRALYASLVEHIPAGVFQKSKEGRYVYVNSRFCRLKGLNEKELLGRMPDEVAEYEKVKDKLGQLDPLGQRIRSLEGMAHHEWILKNGKPLEVEEVYQYEDGRTETFQVVKTPIFDKSGQVVGSQGMLFDITRQKEMQSELLVAMHKAEESDRLKTAFLHNISHEIRTPMNSIIGFSDLLKDPHLHPGKRIHYAEVVIQSSKQLLSIIEDIVRIATIESGQEKICEGEVYINDLCRLAYDQFIGLAQKKKIDFQIYTGLPDENALIVTDRTKVQEVISNLLVNAFKFTEAGHIYLGYTRKGDQLEFYVEDTGMGIPEEMLEDIFKRFRQVDNNSSSSFGGSGLGLSISRAYMEMLGGRLWVKSQVGAGSTFYFVLPYYLPSAVQYQKKKPLLEKTAIDKEDRDIIMLIAEDENYNFILMEEIFASYPIEIIRAVNGAEAVAEVNKRGNIDLVLMDLKMPVMDGYEASRQIRALRPNLPILALTAYAQDTDRMRAIASGCSGFISKPFNKKELIETISMLLNNPQ